MKNLKYPQVFRLVRRSCVRCLQVLKTSLLLLRELPSCLYMIKSFSFRQSLHFFVSGLYVGALSKNFHFISWFVPLSFRSHMSHICFLCRCSVHCIAAWKFCLSVHTLRLALSLDRRVSSATVTVATSLLVVLPVTLQHFWVMPWDCLCHIGHTSVT